MSPSVRLVRAAVVALLVACVDGPTGPGNYLPATLRLRITLPAATPAAWTPAGETLHVAVRRAGRVEPIADTSLQVVGDTLRAVLTVPLAYAVERFVVLGEARYGGLVLFLGFETVQLTAAADTTVLIAAAYAGPGARAASYTLAARDSTLAQGDTASLLPDVRDSAGLAIANVPARYVATNPAVITVDAAGKLTGQAGAPDTARVIGYLPMGLSSSLLVRRVPPVVPGAGRKTWLGSSAVWSDAANWVPAGAPASGDTVEIGASPNNPTLDTDAAVATVRVTGGSLVLNGHTLTVAGDFRTENGAGTLTMQQPDDTLRVLGAAVFQGGPTLALLTDGVLFVRGDFEQRNFADTYGAFEATGNHLTVLNGTTPQRVRPEGDLQFGHLELANTAGQVTGEYDPAFNENEIEVEGKLRFATAVAFEGGDLAIDVEDSLIVSANSRLASRRLRLSGGMRVAGTLSVAVVEFAGDDQEIQPDVAYQDVRVTDGPRLTGTTVFAGSLVIADDGRLDLNGHALTVASLDIGAGTFEGSLIMQHPGGQLTVLGNATFDGDTLPDLLTAGVLRIGGNLTVGTTAGRHLLRAGGSHRTLLNGSGVQVMRLEGRATFGHLEIATAAGGRVDVALTEEIVAFTVLGELRVTTPVTLGGEPAATYRFVSIDVQDSLVTAAGSALDLDHLTLRGGIALNGLLEAEHVEFAGTNQPVPAGIDYNHVTISGTAHLTGATAFRGFTLVRGPQANLRLAGRRLTVNGGFTLGGVGIPEGTLTMTQDADSLVVAGDASFAGASSVGLLTAGTLVVAGGVYGGDEPTAFQPTGTHRTVLNGAGPQTLDFPYPGAAQSRFNDLELANTSGGLWLRSDVHVAGQLRAAGAAQTLTGIAAATLSATSVDVARLTLDSIALAVGGGTITRLDSVTFQRPDRAAAQLVVAHPGAATPFTFTGLRFLSPPSTGLYVRATDVAPADGAVLTLNLAGTTPADGSAHTATAGGAVVNWTGGAPPGPSAWSQLSAGLSFTCGLNAAGAAYCWGLNSDGQLGDGTTTNRAVPTAVLGGLTFTQISAGGGQTCALTAAGAGYCWGANASGQLGDNTNTPRLAPVAVSGGLTFTRISAGDQYACALTGAGALYCWGRSLGGRLGDGTNSDRYSPNPVVAPAGVAFAEVVVGLNNPCAVSTTGAGYCWGPNPSGQLGDGTTTDRWVPTVVSGGLTFAQVVPSAEHACGVAVGGAAYCWGANPYGALGDGSLSPSLTPVAVSGGLSFASLGIGGNGFTCGLTTAGAAYCWGLNNVGQLGDGTQTNHAAPAPVLGGQVFAALRVGFAHVVATTAGAGYAWGGNTQGQLGDGTTTLRTTPVPIVTP